MRCIGTAQHHNENESEIFCMRSFFLSLLCLSVNKPYPFEIKNIKMNDKCQNTPSATVDVE